VIITFAQSPDTMPFLLVCGARTACGATMLRQPTHSALFLGTSAFEEKTNNPYKQGNKKLNTVKGIHRYEASKLHEAHARQGNVIKKNHV
jgi:hypothetical protein